MSPTHQRKERIPDTFAGVKTELKDFICHFETVARWNGWNEEEKGANLAISLRGSAQQVLRDLSEGEREDFSAILRALERRFDPGERESLKRLEFRNRQRRRDESIVEFGFALNRLVHSAYPTMSVEAKETLAIDQFIAGLPSRDLRRHVQFGHPSSVHEAIALATEFESFDAKVDNRKPEDAALRGIAEKGEGEMVSILKDLSQQVKTLGKAQSSLEARLREQVLFSNEQAPAQSDNSSFGHRNPNVSNSSPSNPTLSTSQRGPKNSQGLVQNYPSRR